jgi:hypothetical protein
LTEHDLSTKFPWLWDFNNQEHFDAREEFLESLLGNFLSDFGFNSVSDSVKD